MKKFIEVKVDLSHKCITAVNTKYGVEIISWNDSDIAIRHIQALQKALNEPITFVTVNHVSIEMITRLLRAFTEER